MKRRQLSRHAYDRAFARESQLCRLEGIARGELEPMCDREDYFLWTLRQGDRVDFADFILPLPLLLVELAAMEVEDADALEEDATAPPFTPPLETAISPE